MDKKTALLIDRLAQTHSLSLAEYEYIIKHRNREAEEYARTLAVEARKRVYGNTVYIRGLIEIGNICKNNCLYCGIRRDNTAAQRYRLDAEDILSACREGYELGFRTFVLQGGEDGYFDDLVLSSLIRQIKENYPDTAVTLSLGERSRESYKILFFAGADRYLLRHETASPEHYARLHPKEMSHKNRMECLKNLKEIGYQVGCGFMVGSPYQSERELAMDLKFIEEFAPDMCGIGPFIPHKATDFAKESAGSVSLCCYLLSIIRLISPKILLPATTALGTLSEDGRERGILAGANVVMPNLSPREHREKYELYDNKLCTDAESAQSLDTLRRRMQAIGYEIVVDRGDAK